MSTGNHVVKMEIVMHFEEMDGTSEESALLALDFIHEACEKHLNGFMEFYNVSVKVIEHYELGE